MPTTVHIPPRLLAWAQRRAKALGISRNRLIVLALERELGEAGERSAEFLQAQRSVDASTSEAAGELLAEVLRRRRSKAVRRGWLKNEVAGPVAVWDGPVGWSGRPFRRLAGAVRGPKDFSARKGFSRS